MVKFIDKIYIPSGTIFYYDYFGLSSHTLEGLIEMLPKEEPHNWYDIHVLEPDKKMVPLDSELEYMTSDANEFRRKVENASRYRRLILSGTLDEVFIEICSIFLQKYGAELNYSFDMGYMYGNYPKYSDGEHVKVPYNSWWESDGYYDDTEHAIILRKCGSDIEYPRPVCKEGYIGYAVSPSNSNGDILGDAYNNLMTFPTALLSKLQK